MKKVLSVLLAFSLIIAMVPLSAISANAAISGYYTYRVIYNEVTITDVSTTISGDIIIPSELGGYPVTSIGYKAFYGCSSLTSIEIPESVTSIGDYAFYNCSSLDKVNISDIAKWCNISFESASSNPLYYANNLYINDEKVTDLVIPSSVTSIGDYAFYKCSSLTSIEIPESVTSIGSSAFYDCSSLTSIEIPESVTSIGDHAFYKCSSLTSIKIPASVTSIGDWAFWGCYNLSDIWYTGNETDKNSISIGEQNDYLRSATWHYNICENYNHSYSGICDAKCNNCGYIRIPGDHVYDNDCDKDCNICGTEREVGEHVYDNACDPDCNICGAIREVGEHVYDNTCDTSCNICGAMRTITHTYDNACDADCNICGFVRTPPLKLEYHDYSLTARVVDCDETVAEIIIPDIVNYKGKQYTVVAISDEAFKNCSLLTQIVIPDFVTGIGECAFENCVNLEMITIGDNVKEISYNAFFGCNKLKKIDVGRFNQDFTSMDGVLFDKAMSVIYTFPMGKNGSYSIPNGVKTVSSFAFYSCTGLSDVEIPDSVVYIKESAFEGCMSLSSATMSKNIDTIGRRAFKNCTSLSSISIPENTDEIMDYAFENCSSLKQVDIPYEVSFYEFVFKGCTAVEYMVLPSLVTWIDGEPCYLGAFFGATNSAENSNFVPKSLKEVVITNATAIDTKAFYGCNSIESITIPNNVESIGQYAFQGCNALKKLTVPFVGDSIEGTGNTHFGYFFGTQSAVPDSLKEVVITNATEIDDDAFYNLDSITTLRITNKLSAIGENSFENCSGLTDVYYSGTRLQADAISIGANNECLINAIWHYNTCSSPTGEHTGGIATCKDKAKCSVCGESYGDVDGKSHIIKWYVTKATLNTNGKKVYKCSVCGRSFSSEIIYRPKAINLSTTSYTYNGKAKTPSVTVKDSSGKALKKDTDYTVKYASGRTNVGKYAVTVTFKGNYSGTKTLYFTINPAATSKISVSQTTSFIKATWSKVGGVSGYKVSLYNGIKLVSSKEVSNKITSYTFGKLAAGTSYTVKLSVKGINYLSSAKSIATATKTKTPSISSLKGGSKSVAMKWSNVSGENGYQVYYATSKKGTYKKATTLKANDVDTTIKKLKKGKTYYFKVRAYKTTSSGTVYSEWSAVKSVKVK